MLVLNILSLIVLFITLILIILNKESLNQPIILHYDSFGGIDLFGTPNDLWGIWLAGLVTGVVNVFLGAAFFYRERILTYLFLGANVVIAILVLVAVANIISVN